MSLIAHYMMNDNLATDVIIDEIGGHNGAVKDAAGTATSEFHSVRGRVNQAQDFDGTDDYIEIPDHADFSPGNSVAGSGTPFSISMWVYIHDAEYFVWASKWEVWGVGTNQEWNMYTGTPKKINFRVYDQSANASIGRLYKTELDSTGADCEGKWTHFVATYDGGTLSSGIKIYLNGNRVDDDNSQDNHGSFVAVENLDHAVWIGRYTTKYSDGLIDNVMFFNHELSPVEVEILHSGTEVITDLDRNASPRRCDAADMPLRQRYEF